MIRVKTPPKVTENARLIRLANIAYSFCRIGTCKGCGYPYPQGYVCQCGWDDSNTPCKCGIMVASYDVEKHLCGKLKVMK